MTQPTAQREHGLRRVESLLGNVLRAGVATSVALLLIGIGVSLIRHPGYISDPSALAHLIQPGAGFPHTLSDLAAELKQGRGRALATLGLITLIVTPLCRVVVAIVGMLVVGDRRFALLSGVVLLILIASMLLGAA